jgi:hypothetical protein
MGLTPISDGRIPLTQRCSATNFLLGLFLQLQWKLENRFESGLRLVLAIEQEWIVCAARHGISVLPRHAVSDTPHRDAVDLVALLVENAEQLGIAIGQLFFHLRRQPVLVGVQEGFKLLQLELRFAQALRYFTDGVVIGSRESVNETFEGARERVIAKRKGGARRMRGSGAAAAGELWSMRDLRVRI